MAWFFSRKGFNIPIARRFPSSFANSRFRRRHRPTPPTCRHTLSFGVLLIHVIFRTHIAVMRLTVPSSSPADWHLARKLENRILVLYFRAATSAWKSSQDTLLWTKCARTVSDLVVHNVHGCHNATVSQTYKRWDQSRYYLRLVFVFLHRRIICLFSTAVFFGVLTDLPLLFTMLRSFTSCRLIVSTSTMYHVPFTSCIMLSRSNSQAQYIIQMYSRTIAYLEEVAQNGHLGVVYTTPTVAHVFSDDRIKSNFLQWSHRFDDRVQDTRDLNADRGS